MQANPDPAPSIESEDVGGMPDWAIAVVVIGLGSFMFVLVFGITVVSKKARGGPTLQLSIKTILRACGCLTVFLSFSMFFLFPFLPIFSNIHREKFKINLQITTIFQNCFDR